MATKTSINKILSKKGGWTGKEVGQALMLTLRDDLEIAYKKREKRTFPASDLQRMRQSIIDNDDEYNVLVIYQTLYNTMLNTYQLQQTWQQQFYNGYYHYLHAIRDMLRTEETLHSMGREPLVLPKDEYNDLISAAREYKAKQTLSFYNLFWETVRYYNGLEGEILNEEDIQAITDAEHSYKGQPVTNSRILANWSRDTRSGYEELPDGTRSDQVSKEAWDNAFRKEYLRHHKYTVNGQVLDFEETVKRDATDHSSLTARLLFQGADAIRDFYEQHMKKPLPAAATDKKILETVWEIRKVHKLEGAASWQTQLETLIDLPVNVEWHDYDVPEDLDKLRVWIADSGRYRGTNQYRINQRGRTVKEISAKEQFKELMEDYPVLYNAIKEYIEKHTGKTIAEDAIFDDGFITYGELGKLHFIGYDDGLQVTNRDVYEYLKTKSENSITDYVEAEQAKRGIAMVDSNMGYYDYKKTEIDEEYFYDFMSIVSLSKDQQTLEYYKSLRTAVMVNGLKNAYAANALINVLSDVYDVPFMKNLLPDVFQFDIMEGLWDNANDVIARTYCQAYGPTKEVKRKRDFLRNNFSLIDYEAIKPNMDKVQQIKDTLIQSGITKETGEILFRFKDLLAIIANEHAIGGDYD